MTQKVFEERVLPSIGFFIMFLLLPLAIWLVFLPVNLPLGIASACISYLVVMFAAFYAAPNITVDQTQLSVSNAKLPRVAISRVEVISGDKAFTARGIDLDARAFTKFQFGVKTLVRVHLKDELDPAPYWLIGTRNPEALAAALSS